jgi:hypothetical protein
MPDYQPTINFLLKLSHSPSSNWIHLPSVIASFPFTLVQIHTLLLLNFFDHELICKNFIVSEVEVAKTATVAVLKKAVEAAFSHIPTDGPEKISWCVY